MYNSVGVVNIWRDYSCAGGKGIWEIFVPSYHYYCEPKTALKIFSLKTKQNKTKHQTLSTFLVQGEVRENPELQLPLSDT